MKHLPVLSILLIAICTVVAAAVLPKVVDRDDNATRVSSPCAFDEAKAADHNHLSKRTNNNNNKDDNAWVQDFLRAQARFSYLPDPHHEGTSRTTAPSQAHRQPPPQTVAQPTVPILPSVPLPYPTDNPPRSRSTTARTFTELLQLLQNRFPIMSSSLLHGNPLQQASNEALQQPNAYIWNHGNSQWELPHPTFYPSQHVSMHNWTQMAMQGGSALDPASTSTSTFPSQPHPLPAPLPIDEQLTRSMHPHQLFSRVKQPHPHRYHPYASSMSHLLNSGRLPITMSDMRYQHLPHLAAPSPLWQHLSSSQEEAHNNALLAATTMQGHLDQQHLSSLGMMNSQQQSQQQHNLYGNSFFHQMPSSSPPSIPPPPPVISAEVNALGYPHFQRLHDVAQRWPAPHEAHQEVDQPIHFLQDGHISLMGDPLHHQDIHGLQRVHAPDVASHPQAQHQHHQQQQQVQDPSQTPADLETPHLPLDTQQSASVKGRNEYLHNARPSPQRADHRRDDATLPPPQNSVPDHPHQGQQHIATNPQVDRAPPPSSTTPHLVDDHQPSDVHIAADSPHHVSNTAIAHQPQQDSLSSPSSHKSYPPPRSSQSDSAGGAGKDEDPHHHHGARPAPPQPPLAPTTLPSFINYEKERARYLRNAQTFGWAMESEPWTGPIIDPIEANQRHPESAFWRGLIQDSYKMDQLHQQINASKRRKGKMPSTTFRISDDHHSGEAEEEEQEQEQRGDEWDKLTNDQANFLDKVLKLSRKIRVPGAPRMERFKDISPAKRDDHIFRYLQQKIYRIRNRMQEGHTWDIEDNELLQYLIDREHPGTEHISEVYRTQKDRIVDSWGTKPKSLAKMATNPLGMRAEDFLSLLMSKKQGEGHSPSPSSYF